MNRLYLLRHAEAGWQDTGHNDHQRSLTNHGQMTATKIGQLFQTRSFLPEHALVSSALRTCQTFKKMLEGGMPLPKKIDIEDALYLCGRDGLVNALRDLNTPARQILVVNHNPDLPNLVEFLCRHHHQPQPDLMKQILSDFSPGSLAIVDGGAWNDIALGWGQLVEVVKGL